MPLYVLRLSLEHLSFRLPSLLSISQVFGFKIKFVSEDPYRGLLVVEVAKEEDINHILERDTLIQSATELYAQGTSYEELQTELRGKLDVLKPYENSTFKFTLESTNHRVPESRAVEVIETFEFTGLKGKIRLKDPEVEFVIFEDYDWEVASTVDARYERDGKFKYVFFGRRIGFGTARHLTLSHAVKDRAYYGNTAMDALMGFLMAGQALPAPGKLIYDPFVGTGSMLYAVAHWGAYVIGSDIDGRQMRGKMKGKNVRPGILRAAAQYGTEDKFLDCLTYDVTRSPIRRGGWIDAIITDPPYGVRAGAKRLGRKEGKKPQREEPYMFPDGTYSHKRPEYLPPSRPYELANLCLDLILLARYLLVPKGRLVFFLPTVNEDWQEIDIPKVEGMRELKVGEGSVQDFGKWGRRLITMEKTAVDDGLPPTFEDHDEFDLKSGPEYLPGHHGFNKRYASGFSSRHKSQTASPASDRDPSSSEHQAAPPAKNGLEATASLAAALEKTGLAE
ncbi:tRNA (guanine10-N2)-methyltransferase [Kwoniella heveanensis CBS 569]|uniref:tRNA (guanine(10)-N(2))-methyltransferase n=1 Tax=Kwoniella heveanensis BCC8398 TaxID=1296120 RepID=A0A1B9GJQ0_9TREE|nr:tRNA (guanine10-N2)-methyltransferase [Kwoniella heveanensis BCC8398]OCF41653.1 tRNA (guanine10-N2)-methyltransferase [Kwoniella heveanensis CBS 569]